MREFVSIVVPIHNGEKTLNRCVDSLLQLAYKFFEILLIDYCSEDLSSQICEQYSLKDTRVRVFHIGKLADEKEKYYLPTILNFALKNAKGKWITFVKQEDWVKKQHFSLFFHGDFIERNSIYIALKWEGFSINTLQREKIKFPNGLFSVESLDIIQNNLTIFGKLYSKRLINSLQLRFDENLFYSYDELFTLKYLKGVTNLHICKNNFSYYSIKVMDYKYLQGSFENYFNTYCSLLAQIKQTWKEEYKDTWFIKYFKILVYFCLQEKVSFAQKKTNLMKIRNIPNTKDILLEMINSKEEKHYLWQLFLKRKYSHLLIIGVLQSRLLLSLYAHQKYSLLKHYLK